METCSVKDFKGKFFLNSDPTYEAWKLKNSREYPVIYRVFRSYLWGMETQIKLENQVIIPDSDPTYEAWKPIAGDDRSKLEDRFRSYLWGMETRLGQLVLFSYSRIPILPMRHGNPLRYRAMYFSPYLIPILPMRHGNGDGTNIYSVHLPIPILPMRHGNLNDVNYFYARLLGFRSYLWGMETACDSVDFLVPAKFRSYLWGMETERFWYFLWFEYGYSDPTYEAWKLPKPAFRLRQY